MIVLASNLTRSVFQVIDETLSPTWDEMLIFNEVVLYGNMEEIKDEPPTIVVEIFDQDRVVSQARGVQPVLGVACCLGSVCFCCFPFCVCCVDLSCFVHVLLRVAFCFRRPRLVEALFTKR